MVVFATPDLLETASTLTPLKPSLTSSSKVAARTACLDFSTRPSISLSALLPADFLFTRLDTPRFTTVSYRYDTVSYTIKASPLAMKVAHVPGVTNELPEARCG